MIELPANLKAEFTKLSEHHLVKALDQLFNFALNIHASDIHFESQQDTLKIRLRVDGLLQNLFEVPARFGPMLLSRLKIMAHLDIAERRLPQDGRIEILIESIKISGRMSTCPTIYGEKLVVRLLPTPDRFVSLFELGMTDKQMQAIHRLLESPHGLVIVTGPTGSGKTMTLYALLDRLNTQERNLISVEDPIEMIMPGVNQIQVQEKIGLEFKMILRSLLRQDPDVLMIGEIRDQETAEIAVKAAQTGHLVLSTLHTASSMQAISRLEQLGIPRYLILEATKLIMAQRLVRKHTHPGRTGIFELLEMTPENQNKIIADLILDEEDYVANLNLLKAGVSKVESGITLMSEVKRVV